MEIEIKTQKAIRSTKKTYLVSNDWVFVAILNNLFINKPINGEYISIVTISDERIRNLKDVGFIEDFLNRFNGQFGERLTPSILIMKKDLAITAESVVAYRNGLSISSITESLEHILSSKNTLPRLRYSDYFDIYPYTLASEGPYLVANTPAFIGLNMLEDFQGQSNPGLACHSTHGEFFDNRLFRELEHQWIKHFVSKKREVKRRTRLFRSLEIAYIASKLPYDNLQTVHDHGSKLQLWVSAFEVLAHPSTKHVNVKDVWKLLDALKIQSQDICRKKYWVKYKNKRHSLNFVQKLYWEIFIARNNFGHGNKVTSTLLHGLGNNDFPTLITIAPLIYKCALYSFLDLWKEPQVEMSGSINDFMKYRKLEEALKAMKEPVDR